MKTETKTIFKIKKMFVPVILLCFQMFMICSCEEDEKTQVTGTVSVTLVKNQSYTFIMPANQSDDPFEITEQASHAEKSNLEYSAEGSLVYVYTPAYNYTGTDRVVIANAEKEMCGNGGGKSGHCGNDKDIQTQRTIIINFTIIADNSKPLIENQVK